MTTDDYKGNLRHHPRQPGVYRFIDKEDTILYVGKAKDLRSRVSSTSATAATAPTNPRDGQERLPAGVHRGGNGSRRPAAGEHPHQEIPAALQRDAARRQELFLHLHQERALPRVFITRRVIKDGSTTSGPYTSKGPHQDHPGADQAAFPVAHRHFNLSPENIEAGKVKVAWSTTHQNCMGLRRAGKRGGLQRPRSTR